MTHAERTKVIHTLKRKLNMTTEQYAARKAALNLPASAAHMTAAQHETLANSMLGDVLEREGAKAERRYEARHATVSDEEALAVLG